MSHHDMLLCSAWGWIGMLLAYLFIFACRAWERRSAQKIVRTQTRAQEPGAELIEAPYRTAPLHIPRAILPEEEPSMVRFLGAVISTRRLELRVQAFGRGLHTSLLDPCAEHIAQELDYTLSYVTEVLIPIALQEGFIELRGILVPRYRLTMRGTIVYDRYVMDLVKRVRFTS